MAELSKLRIEREDEARKSSGLTKIFLYIVVIAAIGLVAYFLYRGPLKPAVKIKVTTVTSVYPSQANSALTASGYVVAQRKADVASKGTGRLEYLAVEEGTVVKKGQIIGRLENKDMQAAVAQAEADLNVAEATLLQAKADFNRKKSLFEQDLVSGGEHDIAEAEYKRGIAGVAAARARLRSAQVDLEHTYIRAPFDGTVLTKNADVGDIVAPFGSASNSKGAVVSMADMDSLQVEADVSESSIERIQVNQPTEITLDAFPEKRYRGAVHMIVPTADRAKATVMAKIRFVDKDDRVLPEMSAKVAFLTREITEAEKDAKPKITVDPAAVVERNQKKVVYVVREETVIEKPITTGQMVGNAVEVVSGLSPGDQVVLNPMNELKSGTKVKVTE